MDPQEHLDSIRAESARLVAAAEAAGLDAPVASCPDWTVADLLGHIGTVQRWSAGIVERRATEMDYPADVGRPDDPSALPEWVGVGAARLVEVCAATPPDAAVWTFPGMGQAAFWFRLTEEFTKDTLRKRRILIEPHISIHGLRHTWASLAAMAGVPLMVIAKNLGHTDTRMPPAHLAPFIFYYNFICIC